MPTFNPPLGRETTVPITPEDHDRFVHLSFSLSFEIGEDASGSWELWTDIPDVDGAGQLITGPGEWRAVPFISPTSLNTVDSEDQAKDDASKKEGFVITIPPAPVTSAPPPTDPTLIAKMVVPAHNASYAYTHRRVMKSGETRWLGNGGDNGVVRVVQCEAITKHVERKEWKGVGIELSEDREPVVHQLPVDDDVKASILLLQSVPPIVQPIHQIFKSPKKDITHTPESLVIVSNDLRPVSIQRNSTSPVAAGLQEHFDPERSFSEILANVCKENKSIKVIANTHKGIVAFYYQPHDSSAYLIVHNTVQQSVDLVLDGLTNDLGEKVMIAIKELSANAKGYRSVPVEGLTKVTFDRPSDDTRNVLVFDIAHFNMFPAKGHFFPLAGHRAVSQILVSDTIKSSQIEQTILMEPAPINHADIEPSAPDDKHIPEYQESAGQGISEVPDLISDDGDSIGSGSESPAPQTDKQPSFLSWFKRFFVGFWSWLFGQSSSKDTDVQGTKDDDDIPGSGTVTPNERTHLLSSPQSSAATSSTAVSPSNSPGPEPVAAKFKTATDDFRSRMMSLDECTAICPPLTPEQIGDPNQEPMDAIFTFAQHPFRFFFEQNQWGPTSFHAFCHYRRVGDEKWYAGQPPDIPQVNEEGYCDEVVVGVTDQFIREHGVKEGDNVPWEVRWTVI